MSEKYVIILGAGPAGLAVGHELTANKEKVVVLEKQSFVGGLCRTIQSQGYRFDLGGHRWFTKNESLNEWFRQLMADEIVMVNRISRIYYKRKYFFYPIQIGNIIKETGFLTIIHAGITFVWSMLKQSVVKTPIVNMEQAYKAQFGSKLYDMFFRRYTEKVWGLPCTELSSDWVSQRSKGLSIWSILHEALIGGNEKKYTSLIDEFMYPRFGYVRVPERMAEDIVARGCEIKTSTAVSKIIYHGENDLEVFYKSGDQELSERGSDVVSTIPMNYLAKIIEPACDESVIEACDALSFRALITVNVMIHKKQVSKDTWLYVQDENVIFGRLHEPKNWSPDMVKDDDHTSLVLECFCSVGDEIWSMSDDDIAQRCLRDLVDKLKFITDEEYDGASVIRTYHAYPVYDLDYLKNTTVIKEYLAKFKGLHIVGRGGTHRYNNSDHSVEMGLLLGQKILGQNVDHLSVNTENDYQEIIGENDEYRPIYQFNSAKDKAESVNE